MTTKTINIIPKNLTNFSILNKLCFVLVLVISSTFSISSLAAKKKIIPDDIVEIMNYIPISETLNAQILVKDNKNSGFKIYNLPKNGISIKLEDTKKPIIEYLVANNIASDIGGGVYIISPNIYFKVFTGKNKQNLAKLITKIEQIGLSKKNLFKKKRKRRIIKN